MIQKQSEIFKINKNKLRTVYQLKMQFRDIKLFISMYVGKVDF